MSDRYIRLDDTGLGHLIDLIKRDTQMKLSEGNNIGIDNDVVSVTDFATNLEIDQLFNGGT